ncbi:disease resistance RPP13-like protein 4 [Corylus avellana]|uniref:disease resistance RPP13-like protein 4 n=1 Tax=Corylus avellana TaxID=13451 RepID=UPI00286A60FA|nr:disease resistance RPP13-like protein 4 [Corylus avellana]
MSSSDQSSGAVSVAESKDLVISDVAESLKQAKEFLSRNRPVNINSGNNNGDSGNDGSSHTSQDDYQRMENQAEKLSKDLIYIGESFKSLKGFEDIAIGLLEKLKLHSSDALGTSVPNVSSRPKQLRAKLRAIDKIVMELKLRIPLPYKLSSDKSDAHRYTRGGTEFDDLDVIDDLPVLHVDMGFRNSLAFQDFQSVYESLESTTKLCLLCFALIPENEIVKKRFMTYWWVGEGFVRPEVDDGTLEERRSVEEVADGIFKELAKKHCIEPVNEKHRLVVDSYKMNPCIRSVVIVLAKEAGLFDFDNEKWNPTTNFKTSHRAYLVNGFSQELVKFFNESATEKRGAELDLEKLQTIFNVNEPYPDFFKSEWFSKLKNVKVLYLGRWQTSAKHHIEVESVEFLKGLKNMKLLRFLSLQGISRITKLPDSVCKLLNLRILDLRACHTLEELPDGIGSLENLTHLDISECYLLEYIPKKIKFLSKLRVLKGFVIGDR